MFLQNCGCALARRAMGLGAVLGALALVLPLLVFGLGEGEESEAVLPPEPTPVSSPARNRSVPSSAPAQVMGSSRVSSQASNWAVIRAQEKPRLRPGRRVSSTRVPEGTAP